MATHILEIPKVDLSARWSIENYDEETREKLEEMIELLVAAGYFRARIKTLDAFDKIMGGLSWTITVAGEADHLDMDLRFHDSLSIGEKIALTEKVVRVLQLMKCPHRLEPHQIQGLDTEHVFPVVQWLVKKSIENRVKFQERMKQIAAKQFDNQYGHHPGLPIAFKPDSQSASLMDSTIKRIPPTPAPRTRSSKSSEISQETLQEEVNRLRETEKALQVQLSEMSCSAEGDSGQLESDIKLEAKERIEQLQRDKTQLKQTIRAEKAKMEETIERLRNIDSAEESLVAERERLANVRAELARLNQAIARIERKLDEVPSRIELGQYQKRFAELYAAISTKYNEQKKWISVYNCLQDRFTYLDKELKLLNSIHESYGTISSAAMRDEFVTQLERIVVGVEKSAAQVAQRKESEKRKKDSLVAELNRLAEVSRTYYKYVKLFAEEYRKNELLVSQIKSLER